MLLPENKRIERSATDKKKLFFYAAPFTGKSYLANSFPDVLFLSTDGNYKNLPGGIPPHVDIVNKVEMDGRIKNTTLAWEVFKDTISELEKKQNTFKTIVVDLVEDTYEHARLYMYEQMGIEHESDDSFRAWDRVRTEFLSTIKRLMALDYENIILLSHEDTTKDIMKRSGDKITSIKPNLNDKIANKIAGMVDIAARLTVEDGKRYINFKTDEVVFGGGRLNVAAGRIPCTYEDLMKVYDSANSGKEVVVEEETPKPSRRSRAAKAEDKQSEPVLETPKEDVPTMEETPVAEEAEESTAEEVPVEVKKTRTRKARN